MAKPVIPVFIVLAFVCVVHFAAASDPELLTDFSKPTGGKTSGNYFTFTGFRAAPNPPAGTFKPLTAFVTQFPALNGLGVSIALLEFQPGSLNPPHTHPRATELLFVLNGTLEVGFVDTNNTYFSQTLKQGNVFVFPKGLVHFQLNPSSEDQTFAVAGFSSASPGLVSTPMTLFGSGIPSEVLEKSFSITPAKVMQLEAHYQTSWATFNLNRRAGLITATLLLFFAWMILY